MTGIYLFRTVTRILGGEFNPHNPLDVINLVLFIALVLLMVYLVLTGRKKK